MKVGLNPGAPQGGSGEQYFLGDFDGKTFTQSREPGSHGWTNYGKDDYCAISFNGLPQNQKPVLLGWMSNWQYAAKLPTSPWRGQMSLPRRLSFISDGAGLALKQEPVIAPLQEKPIKIADTSADLENVTRWRTVQLSLKFGSPTAPVFGVKLYSDEQHWTEVGFDTNKKEFYIDRTHAGTDISPDFPIRTTTPLAPNRPYDMTLIVDRSSVEAYAQDGTIAMTNLIYPSSSNLRIQLFPADSKTLKADGHLWELKSIWPK